MIARGKNGKEICGWFNRKVKSSRRLEKQRELKTVYSYASDPKQFHQRNGYKQL